MKMKMKNKKGTDRIVSIYWFAILFIVAGAVVYIVSAFYGKPIDIREIETNLLINKLSDCVGKAGYVSPEIYSEGGFLLNDENLLDICKINFNSGGASEGDYYAEIQFKNFNSGEILSSAKAGNFNLKDYCNEAYLNSISVENPVCVQRSFYALNQKNEQYEIKLIAGIKKVDESAK